MHDAKREGRKSLEDTLPERLSLTVSDAALPAVSCALCYELHQFMSFLHYKSDEARTFSTKMSAEQTITEETFFFLCRKLQMPVLLLIRV